jgi:phosphate acetyltransferase
MIHSLFISSAEPYSGKSLVTIGIFEAILRRTPKVAFFKPIIRDPKNDGDKDKNIELILTRYNLDQSYEDSFAFHRKKVQKLIGRGK